MAREVTGDSSEWRVFITESHDNLSAALQEAANVMAGVEVLHPDTYPRVIHQYDMTDGTHDILIVLETV